VPIYFSGFGPQATALAGRIGDGYCTTMPDADLVRVFREAGDPKRPAQGALKVCWAETEQAGVETAHRLWASDLLPGQLGQMLPRPRDFEAATSLVTREAVAQQVPCGPDLQRQVEAVQRYVDAGFDEVYVQQIGSHHEEFFRAWADEVLPSLR
jgi:G6PDH family F420-dependent oxidoreductase